MRRQARMASVDGRPSRRKNEPGMRPAAYIRSSTSTVSGKKSKPSRGCLPAVVADSSAVSSSMYTMAAPAACLARRPVSKRITRLPKRPLSMTASENWISGPSKRVTSVSWLTEVQPHQPSPASVYWPALHPVIDRDPRAGLHSSKPFPGITTEDRECVMRLILLFSFV
ncbi:hypothetical protein D9M72_384130 [compost metagenome]